VTVGVLDGLTTAGLVFTADRVLGTEVGTFDPDKFLPGLAEGLLVFSLEVVTICLGTGFSIFLFMLTELILLFF
jgi:hypothetical protein